MRFLSRARPAFARMSAEKTTGIAATTLVTGSEKSAVLPIPERALAGDNRSDRHVPRLGPGRNTAPSHVNGQAERWRKLAFFCRLRSLRYHPHMTLRSCSVSAMSLVLLALVGCSSTPEVEVTTRVGDPEMVEQWLTEFDPARLLARLEQAPEPTPGQPSEALAPPQTPEMFAEYVEAIRTGSHGDLRTYADALNQTPPTLWEPLREHLLAPRKARKTDYIKLLSLIGGDVPNRYGHFERAWKRSHGYKVKLSENWYEDLLTLKSKRVSRVFRKIYRDCVLEVALLQAAANIGREHPKRTAEVVDTLLAAAYIHEGTFRDEVGRAIRGVGREALPTLVLRSIKPEVKKKRKTDPDPVELLQAKYAEYQLDRMDKLHPQRALKAVADNPRLLAELLAAYAQRRPPEASKYILESIDSPIPRVRRSAREALLAYTTGPAPKVRRKSLRLLGGGTTMAAAQLSYRGAVTLALDEFLAANYPALHLPLCELYDEQQNLNRECELQPQRLTHALLDHLDASRRATQEKLVAQALESGDLQQSVDILDRLLAADPEFGSDGQRETMVGIYTRAADSAYQSGQFDRSAQLLRKSAHLIGPTDTPRATSLQAQALLAEAKIANLPRQGRQMLLNTAAQLVPDDPRVKDAQLELRVEQTHSGLEPMWALSGVGLLAGGLWILSVLGGAVRRRLNN